MKELYNAPELEIVTFMPIEELASGYLSGYIKNIGGADTTVYADGTSGPEIDIPVPGDPID